MDIAERAQALALKIRKHKDGIETEEATKNAFVMPFISTVLGYDVFNPAEVIPEFTADVGTKRGEKIDYAIVHNGQVQVLVEAKKINDPLKIEHASQLFRYFAVTNARIAVLTNGQVYQFYTDLDAPNRMDAKPFLVMDFSDIDETLLPELAKLTKEDFDLDSVISAAGELKYIGQLKRILAAQFKEPEDEWVKFLTTRVYEGAFTQRVREQFGPLVSKATRQFLNEQVNDRLKNASAGPTPTSASRVAPHRSRSSPNRRPPKAPSATTTSSPPKKSWRATGSSAPSSAARCRPRGSPRATPRPTSACCSTTTTASPSRGCGSTARRSTSASSTRTRPKPGSRSRAWKRSTPTPTTCDERWRGTWPHPRSPPTSSKNLSPRVLDRPAAAAGAAAGRCSTAAAACRSPP
ncbi:type I restriction endonuclease [Amycolatopsis sp. WQ 127309]|uniref:type I restriction endonuclease n=1 Tax=Amycolatopsis sp. WQ 127309 TaxID=2932773 RepID=UPI001FF6D504|nr:type I restriction endonuclease [Amycolatopsis sp. WQ 127309]UOZ06464.1 type I restriction endonuclease [Amycolatopsis sp. WQ 127309]